MKALIVNLVTRIALFLTVKLDKTSREELKKIPPKGPSLLISNHVSSMEAPLLYLGMRPRRTIALGKQELWDKWLTRQSMEAWECIPISREGVDQKAIGACMEVLNRGDFLCIAPEGTRSKSGRMQKAKPGVTLFCRPGIPLIPVAVWGLESYKENLKRFRRTPVSIRVGEPYVPARPKGKMTSEKRQEMVDDMMVRIARLMPPEYRGYYAEMAD